MLNDNFFHDFIASLSSKFKGFTGSRGWRRTIALILVLGNMVTSSGMTVLKEVNDSLGHAAGDELIKGAAECFVSSIGNRGTVYRMGGDEFQSIVFSDHPDLIMNEIRKKTENWKGKMVQKLAVSVGYATAEDVENPTITAIERVADERMYEEKRDYYQREGIDRRCGSRRR